MSERTSVLRTRQSGMPASSRLPRWARGRYATQVVVTVLSLLALEALTRAVAISWLPPPSRVVARTIELFKDGTLPAALGESIPAFLAGYAISVVGGIALGFLMGTFRLVRFTLLPYVSAGLVLPGIALAPVFFAIFGLSEGSIVAIIVVFAMPFIVFNAYTGIENSDFELQEMAHSFGASRLVIFWRITLRSAMPLVAAGLRLGMTRAIKGMIAGQLILSVFGLGGLSRVYAGTFDAEGALSVALVTVIIAMIAVTLLEWWERRVSFWSEN